jgi:hypothetical protein
VTKLRSLPASRLVRWNNSREKFYQIFYVNYFMKNIYKIALILLVAQVAVLGWFVLFDPTEIILGMAFEGSDLKSPISKCVLILFAYPINKLYEFLNLFFHNTSFSYFASLLLFASFLYFINVILLFIIRKIIFMYKSN